MPGSNSSRSSTSERSKRAGVVQVRIQCISAGSGRVPTTLNPKPKHPQVTSATRKSQSDFC